MKNRAVLLLCLLAAFAPSSFGAPIHAPAEFIRARGRRLVVGAGDKEIVLRGFVFGNYVWNNPSLPPTDHHDESDFARIKAWNANAVRFLLNYQLFEDDSNPYSYKQTGWDWLDRNIAWAKKNGIYLILNMHYPQGGYQSLGQGNALWDVPSNQARLKALWKAIAARYEDEATIAGYELLNEPNTSKGKNQWIDLATALIKEIRSADANHLVIVERLNAVDSVWTDPGLDTGFFLVGDDNVMYTFHIYDPFEYTHQYTSWTQLADADGGRYPDESVVYAPPDAIRSESDSDNPRTPSGDFAWTRFDGVKFRVADPATIVGRPVLHSDRDSGEVFFDDLTVDEYDENRKRLRTVSSIDSNTLAPWYFWSANGAGSCRSAKAEGRGDARSICISGTTATALATGYQSCFEAIPGRYYSIGGWMKGVKAAGDSYLSIDFLKSPSGERTMHRDKDYLSHSLSHYLAWGIANDVPLYCGEYGCYYKCYEDGKGGARWLEDMIDLLKEAGISYTFHSYHDPTFGIFLDPGLPAGGKEKRDITDVFKREWK
jgi:endoglucanase